MLFLALVGLTTLVGVFIGFQLGRLIEALSDRAEARRLLAELRNDSRTFPIGGPNG